MKRTLSLILSLLMALSLFTGLSISAAENDLAETGDDKVYTSGNYQYKILDATAIQRHLASLSTNPNIGKPIA